MIGRFRDFELDLTSGELRRGGAVVPLERQPAVVLSLLVSRPGRLVTRADLRRALWPDDLHVDFDGGLNYCIRQLRVALRDEARRAGFIETIPRQGYRFVPDVVWADATPAARNRPRRNRRMVAAAAAALLLSSVFVGSRVMAGPRNPAHHAMAVNAVRALHDLVF
jgi:DNA-binding winged helix-turn-helix (wHTH) protein